MSILHPETRTRLAEEASVVAIFEDALRLMDRAAAVYQLAADERRGLAPDARPLTCAPRRRNGLVQFEQSADLAAFWARQGELAASPLRALVDDRFVWSRVAERAAARERETIRALFVDECPAGPFADLRDALVLEAVPRPDVVVTRVDGTTGWVRVRSGPGPSPLFAPLDPRGTRLTPTHITPNRSARRAAARARKA